MALSILMKIKMDILLSSTSQTSFCLQSPTNPSELLKGFTSRVTDMMNQNLTRPVSDNDIRKIVKAVKSDSAPGADGMTDKFFQHFWIITGVQVTKEVKNLFSGGVINRVELHATMLITKKAQPK